jgi:putative ABC transport system permease protein
MQATCQDLRYAIRGLAKEPGFAAVVLMTLALGMGATTSIFSLVNAVLLRPLPYPEPDRLVQVLKNWKPPWAESYEVGSWFSEQELRAWAKTADLPVQLMGYGRLEVNLSGGNEAERVGGGAVTSSFLPILGIPIALGRNFTSEEDEAGVPPVLILNHGLWKRRFGGDEQVIGRVVQVDNQSYEVVGILPANCRLPIHMDLLLPIPQGQIIAGPKHSAVLTEVIGRLQPGVSREQARVALDRMYQQMPGKAPRQIVLAGFKEQLVGGIRHDLLLFLGAVGCVLLIACANTANLLLARAVHRQKEISIRLAMGASRLRIVRQLLTESTLLALIAAVLGIVLSLWTTRVLQPLVSGVPASQRVHLDFQVLAFAAGVAVVTAIVFGLAPALTMARPVVSSFLKDTSVSTTANPRQHRLRHLLVVAEVSLSALLLLSAGLLLRSFMELRGVDPGIRPDRLLTFAIDLSRAKYPDAASQSAFFSEVIERLRTLPGVEAVGADSTLPFSGTSIGSSLEIEGKPVAQGQWSHTLLAIVNADYCRAMGIPLLRGRFLTDADRAGSPAVAVVNEAFASEHFHDEEPLGKRIKTYGEDFRTVVGVVGNVRTFGLDSPPTPLVYVSYLETGSGVMSLALRTAGSPGKLAAAIRERVQMVDADQPVYSILTMEQRMAGTLSWRRVNMLLLASFSGLALILAAVGIYGVLSYMVTERTREIGIRRVLGAGTQAVLFMVLRRGFVLVAAGVTLGLLASMAFGRVLASELFGITPFDPITIGAVILVLFAVAMAACWFPARRATTVDPAIALRHE